MTIDSGRFENFESDNQYESNLESYIRFEIESNHEASQVPIQNCQIKMQHDIYSTVYNRECMH